MFKWPAKKDRQYAYAISVHKGAVHIAVLRMVSPSESNLLTGKLRQESAVSQSWELVVNDDIQVDDDNYANAIEQLLARYQRFGFKKQPLQMVLSSAFFEQVAVERPDLPNDDIAATLQWTLKDLVTIPAADIIADFYDPPVQVSGAKKINLVAARRSFLSECLAPIHAAQFNVQGIVNADLAIANWFDADERLMLVTQTQRETNQLQIVSKNKLVVSRELNRISPLAKIAPEDMDELEALALELQRSLDFYTGQLRQAPLAEIVLATTHPRASELAEIIGAQLGMQSSLLIYPAWAKELKAGDYTDLAVLSGLMYLFEEKHDGVAESEGAVA